MAFDYEGVQIVLQVSILALRIVWIYLIYRKLQLATDYQRKSVNNNTHIRPNTSKISSISQKSRPKSMNAAAFLANKLSSANDPAQDIHNTKAHIVSRN